MSTDAASCARRRISDSGPGEPTGELRIRARRFGGRTAIVESYRTAPFHLGHPSDRAGDGSVELIVQGVGPGYLPGDRLSIDITAESGASLVVRGQGATKLYPSPHGIPSAVDVSLTVEQGAWLVYLPGELIPFRQSILHQRTVMDVASEGLLVLGEILTPGRVAMGECHQFTRLHLDVEATFNGQTCLIERARLDPIRRPLTSIGRHASFPVAGTLYLIGNATLPPIDLPPGIHGASATGDGYSLVRLLGPTVQAVSTAMQSLTAKASLA
jgi:urease accessory protein